MSKNKINDRLNNLFSEINAGKSESIESINEVKVNSFSWETDLNGLYTFCDPEVKNTLGFNPNEVVGNPFLSFQIDTIDQNALRKALDGDSFPSELDIHYKTKNGMKILLRVMVFQRFGENQTLNGFRGFSQKIEEAIPQQDTLKSISITSVPEPEQPTSQPIETIRFDRHEFDAFDFGVQTGKLPELETDFDSEVYKSPKKKKTQPIEEGSSTKRNRSTSPLKPSGVGKTAPLSLFSPTQDGAGAILNGVAIVDQKIHPAKKVWTKQARTSFDENQLISTSSEQNSPAVIASPLNMRDEKTGVIEIVDSKSGRRWSEEDKLLVQEVTTQLGLALENAQLYTAIQKELVERAKAEEETLRRNKDLATINQIGQRLSRLVSREQIFEILSEMTQNLLNSENLVLSIYNQQDQLLSFPICISDGEPVQLSPRKLSKGYQELVMKSKAPLLLTTNVIKTLDEEKIDHPKGFPLSLLAVPLLSADRAIGVISVLDYEKTDAFDQIQADLLSTVASQAATSLENSNLFAEITNALEVIEVRERIQSNVTKAVATLSEKGSKEIMFLLECLSRASLSERVYYAKGQNDSVNGDFWSCRSIFVDPIYSGQVDNSVIEKMPMKYFPNWQEKLNSSGWYSCNIETAQEPEKTFLIEQGIKSILLLGISLENQPMGFIALENRSSENQIQTEAVEVLRIASDSFNNTLIREALLVQLQSSLNETENLYSASHKLALANNMQEMITALATGINIPAINRGVIILFEYSENNELEYMTVEANYYSGVGTPPPVVGTEYLVSMYRSIFCIESPEYYDDLLKSSIDKNLQEILLRQNIKSMVILPLWTGSVQIGVLVFQSSHEHHYSLQEMRSYPPLADQMATAIQNLRLFEKTQEALSETELLYKISSGIAKSTSFEELSTLIGENVLPTNAETLYLFTRSSSPQTINEEFEITGSYARIGTGIPLGQKTDRESFTFINFSNPDPIIINDTSRSNVNIQAQLLFRKLNFSSIVIVPLQTAFTPVGFLIAGSSRTIDFNPDEIQTLQVVGNSIAVAIERQRLLSEAQRRALELQTAAEIARDTTSTLSFDILLNRIVNLLKDRFGFYHCSIFLLDDTGTYAEIEESTGDAGLELKQKKHKLAIGSKSVIGNCTATGNPVIVNDTSSSPIYYPNPLLPLTKSELGIPLKIGGRVIGALNILSTQNNAFSENEMTVLQILTDQISVAIENARAYEISQQAVEEMREIDRVKSQFLANMSHELRTPLNSVIGFSRVILKGIDGPINDVQEQDITAIYNSGMHLLNMINEILDLSKIEAGKMELQLEEVNLADVINNAISTATGLIKDKPIKLIQKTPPNLPLVNADEIKLNQVVLNLISNAIKFTERGSITIEAELVQNQEKKQEILVTVTDTGIGIALEDQAKLFQRFSQVDDSPTRKTGGTGLGLSISRSLIELHGGRIGLKSSQVGKGSVFYFTLPVPKNLQSFDINQLAHGENVILAIDDDPQVIDLYGRFLKPQGFEVIPLTDPSKAVEKAIELKPFAITLDIMMPVIDGWHVMQTLKQNEQTKEIPILVCSILEEEEKGFSLGASEYLIKPFLQDDLINAIHRLNRDSELLEILIIDDNEDDLKLVQDMVNTENTIHPTIAKGGEQALDILQTLTPDLIILDLFMPNMNGFDLLEKFKTEPRFIRIPLIVITGTNLSLEQQKLLSEASRILINKGLLKERDILRNLGDALEQIRPQ